MINFNLCLRNPWSNKFNNLWCKSYSTPFENKFIELQIYKDFTLVSFMFNWTIRQSHAGLDLEIGILGYCVHFNFCDSRHWDDKNNCWETYE